MTYTKPKNKRYVDLAIEFDKEFYSGNRDDTKLFKYMYLLFYMLACKQKFFEGPDNFKKYDDYSKYAATVVYLRFINKEKKGEKIKSVLNYLKSTVGSLKVMWQNDTFNEILDNKDSKNTADGIKSNMRSSIQKDYCDGMSDDIIEEFNFIPDLIKKVVYSTPYKNDKSLCTKLYISCSLSLINYFSVNNAIKEKIDSNEAKADNIRINTIINNKDNYIILWHLDESYKDLIQTLCNKIKVKLSNNIEEIKHSYILEDNILDDIINSTYDEYVGIDGEEEEEY